MKKYIDHRIWQNEKCNVKALENEVSFDFIADD